MQKLINPNFKSLNFKLNDLPENFTARMLLEATEKILIATFINANVCFIDCHEHSQSFINPTQNQIQIAYNLASRIYTLHKIQHTLLNHETGFYKDWVHRMVFLRFENCIWCKKYLLSLYCKYDIKLIKRLHDKIPIRPLMYGKTVYHQIVYSSSPII